MCEIDYSVFKVIHYSCIEELIQKPLQSLLFSLLLAEQQKKEDYDQSTALLYALSTCFLALLHPLVFHQYFYNIEVAGMIIRSSLSSAIYRKITRVTQQGFMKTNTGEIMNILTNDMNRFTSDLRYTFFVITSPLQCIIVCVILWINIGALPVLGIFGILIMIPLQILFGRALFKFRRKVLKATDARIKLIYEIITSMKIIKLYAWEDSFWKHLFDKRKHEFKQLRRIIMFKGASEVILKSMVNVVIFLSMFGFVLQNKDKISVPKVYLAITMFYSVKYSISSFFAHGLNGIAQLLSSLQRIYNFLSIEEYPSEYPSGIMKTFKENLFIDSNFRPIVELHEVYSSYGKDTDNVVKDISFKLNPGDFICVIGEVGSGKTSLLKTILKEMVVNNGSIKVRGKTAYVCQQSWIFSDTLKNNILFGSIYDQERYNNIINACCLSMDINMMPHGDETVVGERGIKLSGGQRARVSLARALYYDADVYLLDDPLSAVDAEVGNHLYSQCIQGYLENKITILVTHQINFLRNAPNILLLRKNNKPLYGNYETLLEKIPNLTKFFTDSFKNPENSTNKIKNEEALFKGKQDEGIYKLDNIEDATSDSVSFKVYEEFFRAAGNPYLILLTSISLNIIYAFILLSFDYWIKIWTEFEDQKTCLYANCSRSTDHLGFPSNSINQNNGNSLIILSIICLISLLFSIPTIFFDMMFCLRAARNLHDRMFNKLLHAPIKFFNCNPIGEILNRFTKDIGEIDEYIPGDYHDFQSDVIKCIIIILAVCLVEPYLFIVTILLIVMSVFAAKIYMRSFTILKRAENISLLPAKSPVFTHVSKTLDGLSTIRAYGALDRFRIQFNNLQDLNMATYYMYISIQKWFALYAEYIATLMICVVTISPVLFHTVERVLEYGAINSEADRECAKENTPPDNWPQTRSICATNMSLAYNTNKFVLKDISFSIKGGQKVGVIGRTGAGKTSLVNAIFRLEEPSGCLKIDGIDITKIGLHQLRKNISIIPQEPLLFNNTIRYNLDPFGFYNDAKLWSALESVELKSVIGHFPERLATKFTEGTNLSVGQQQLICLARSILKENKIIVLDEATSSVDVITDQIIQNTIRTKFKDFTVITIAHRIHTIIDADVIMVIDNGNIIEMDSPKNLVQNKDGHFYKTILETGSSAPLLIKQSLCGK
ncbi:Multidrug resistance-associated protein 4 [Nymphon striatum]|nr:Multidrug resistance-associated protein 4 [Nymphon striatum]